MSFDVFITYKLKSDTKKSSVESKAEDNNARLQDIIHTTVFMITRSTAVIFATTIAFFVLSKFELILFNYTLNFLNIKDFFYKSNLVYFLLQFNSIYLKLYKTIH